MKKIIGLLTVTTLILYLISYYIPAALYLAALPATLVPLLNWRHLGKTAVRQALLLLAGGVGALVFAAAKGVFLGWGQVLTVNLPLLGMFAAVAFLSLTSREHEQDQLPKGVKAALATGVGIHILGAVINLSALFVFGDRLQHRGVLSKNQMIMLGRAFSAAAWWSPFFIATGVALTYAPQMEWKHTLIPGAVMSIIAIGYSVVEVGLVRKGEFSGYPLQRESLTVPLFLAAVVLAVHHFWPDFNILLLICLVAPTGAFLFMHGRPRLATIDHFIENKIASVSSQFAMFLAAGVFSTGLKSMLTVYPHLIQLGTTTFTPFLFGLLLTAMIAVGMMGVHPIVSIALLSPLLTPLTPNHSQLAFLFLSSWAVTAGSSPLSGVGLALVSRYHASPKAILVCNFHYAIAMILIASGLNMLFF